MTGRLRVGIVGAGACESLCAARRRVSRGLTLTLLAGKLIVAGATTAAPEPKSECL